MNSISLFPAACAGHLWCAFSVDLGPYTDSLPATHPVNAARYIRFMQWGVFSAIFRPHDGGNADTRIWTFADEHYQILRDYTRLRGALTPWVYALAAKTRDESVPFSRPMWWDYENEAAANKEDARAMDEQFGFGEGVLVRPISEFISPDGDTKPPFNSSNVHAINSSSYSVWLPDGCWLNWDATQKICGPVRHSGVAQLRDVPVFVKPGTVLPMWPPGRRLLSEPPAKRTRLWTLFISSAGEVGRGSDHEDDGETLSLNASVTTLRYSYGSALLEVNVSVPVGSYDGMADSTRCRSVASRRVSHMYLMTWVLNAAWVRVAALRCTAAMQVITRLRPTGSSLRIWERWRSRQVRWWWSARLCCRRKGCVSRSPIEGFRCNFRCEYVGR